MDGLGMFILSWVFIIFIGFIAVKIADKQDKDQARHEREELHRQYMMTKLNELEKKDQEKNL